MVLTLQSQLFPPTMGFITGFTTSCSVYMPQITHVSLSDSALGITKVSSGTSHPVVMVPGKNPCEAWEAVYPKGSYAPSSGEVLGGFGFYLAGPEAFASELSSAKGVLTSYSVRFEEGWEWQKGGKLPGQFGGVGSLAYGCSGGRMENRADCFDLRFMWRASGAGELYAYLPLSESNAEALSMVPPLSLRNSDYGFSVGRGSWTFDPGSWTVIAQYVRLNDPGKRNGIVNVWINGSRVMHIAGLELRDRSASVFQGMHFQTFFGGGSSDYASPRTQKAWFSDISGAIVEE